MDTPQEPRWLDAEESQAWRVLAKTLERLPAALDAQLRRDAGISHFEYQVLARPPRKKHAQVRALTTRRNQPRTPRQADVEPRHSRSTPDHDILGTPTNERRSSLCRP